MTDILIQQLTAAMGALPSNGVDSNGLYTSWALSDEALLGTTDDATVSFVVPGSYTPGDDLLLLIDEATAGISQNHKWQASVTRNGGAASTFTVQYTSPGVANQRTVRQMAISTGGQITSQNIATGDEIAIILTRIAASATEDSNSIKVYALAGRVPVTTVTVSYAGRVGEIIDDAKNLVNDNRETFEVGAKYLTWINSCTKEIAKRGYWKKSATITVTASSDPIDLFGQLPDLQTVEQLWWMGTNKEHRLTPLSRWNDWERLQQWDGNYSHPRWYYVAANKLYLSPLPTASGTIRCFYQYLPADLDGTATNCTPEVPRQYDSVYAAYCAAQYMLKDRRGPDKDSNYAAWLTQFRQDLNSLIRQSVTPSFQMRPYR